MLPKHSDAESGVTFSNQEAEITTPIHLTAQFINGKIVRDFGYWDPSEIISNLQEITAQNTLLEAEE